MMRGSASGGEMKRGELGNLVEVEGAKKSGKEFNRSTVHQRKERRRRCKKNHNE